MRKSRKTQNLQKEFKVEQEVVRQGVVGHAFDLIIRFKDKNNQPEIFMDENLQLLLEGLTERYGTILVKINWFDSNLMVIAPNELPPDANIQNDLQGTSEGS